jgi:hypothetical protein
MDERANHRITAMWGLLFLALVPLVVGRSLLTDSNGSDIGPFSVNTKTAINANDEQIMVNQETSIRLPARESVHFQNVSTSKDWSTKVGNMNKFEGIERDAARIHRNVKGKNHLCIYYLLESNTQRSNHELRCRSYAEIETGYFIMYIYIAGVCFRQEILYPSKDFRICDSYSPQDTYINLDASLL